MRLRRVVLALAGAAALAACSPLGAINALLPSDTHLLTRGVAYGAEPRQRFDAYRPVGAMPSGGWPMIVFFYGGSWNSGEREDYRFVGEALAARGIVTVIPDYRLYPQVTYPDFLLDCAAALGYAIGHAHDLGGDPRRVFVMGHSAGGYNAAMLALDARWLAATGHATSELAGWIGLAGPYDFYPIVNPDAKPVFHHPDYPPNSQPIEDARPGSPRSFLGAARNDALVSPQRNTQQLASRLEAAGVAVTVKLYDRASHLTLIGAFARPLRWLAPVLDDVVTFVEGA